MPLINVGRDGKDDKWRKRTEDLMVSKPALASQRDKAQVAEEGDNWVRYRMWDQLYLA